MRRQERIDQLCEERRLSEHKDRQENISEGDHLHPPRLSSHS